ncbi:Gfo/Idh/MocA family oxidoreductase [Ferrimicrobium sp.]|uniref:Gfo/Idh/MocA family protein n=1 Tax=Ferrimicrobium sp. TaxID=2926050 RepID=UPI002604BF95|nr:Gfo/Idh/MocA family oxidoreductase [Ferrimicrobium sp.]
MNVAVCGLGSYVAQAGVIPALRHSPWTRFLGGTTRSPSTASQVLTANETHYQDYTTMLADPAVEAIYLPLPNDLHFTYIQRAVEAGKHVLCEKPLFLTENDYTRLDNLLNDTGLLVAEAFMSSYHPRLRAVLSSVTSGSYGPVINVQTTFTGTLTPLSGYRLDPTRGGGSLFDVGIYAIHPIVSLLGSEPSHIWTTVMPSEQEHPVDLTLEALLAYDGGVAATFTTSFIAGESQALRVLTREATIEMDHVCTPRLEDTTWTVTTKHGITKHDIASADPYQAMVDEVFASFSNGHEPSWNLAESRRLAHLLYRIHATTQSALRGD